MLYANFDSNTVIWYANLWNLIHFGFSHCAIVPQAIVGYPKSKPSKSNYNITQRKASYYMLEKTTITNRKLIEKEGWK